MIAAGLRAPEAPLGQNRKSASALAGDAPSVSGNVKREVMYRLRDLAGDLLPGEAVCRCGWQATDHDRGVAVMQRGESLGIGGVRVCGSVWVCPVCSVKVAHGRAQELDAAMKEWRRRGGVVWLLTLTVRHDRGDDLASSLDALTSSMRSLWAGRWGQWFRRCHGIVGLVRNLEATWGAENGWHPHAHALVFVDPWRAMIYGPHVARDELSSRWMVLTAAHGFGTDDVHGVSIEAPDLFDAPDLEDDDADRDDEVDELAAYAVKVGGVEALAESLGKPKPTWGPAQELTFSHIKRTRGKRFTPWMLLAACESWTEAGDASAGAPALWQEYAQAFKGRRQLVWSAGLRDLLALGEAATDEALAQAEDEQAVEVARVPVRVWYYLRRHGLVPSMLSAGESGGLDALANYLDAAANLSGTRELPYAWMRWDAVQHGGRGSLLA